MKELNIFVILLSFALFSVNNGFHVQRTEAILDNLINDDADLIENHILISDQAVDHDDNVLTNDEKDDTNQTNVESDHFNQTNEENSHDLVENHIFDENDTNQIIEENLHTSETNEESNHDLVENHIFDENDTNQIIEENLHTSETNEENNHDLVENHIFVMEGADPDDADHINEENHPDEIKEEIEEMNSYLQSFVTDIIPDDGGVEGELENIQLEKLCDGSKHFLPSTKNCSLFYDCDNKEGSSCPHGMWFDPNYIGDTLCQYPEVICAADNTVCDCAHKYPRPPPDPLMEDSISCLKDNIFHLISSKVSCSRYYICHNEMKYRMECRQGFHYNAKTEMCDYAEVVNCRIPDPDCPVEGIKFLPDTKRCDVFYFCVHGYKTKQMCPFYHIWDIRSNSCRRQDEAICHLETLLM